MDILAFDIETVPDTDGFRRLEGLDGVDDADTARIMFHRRRQEAGTDFLRLHLQRVVAISCVLRRGDELQVWTLGEVGAGEAEIVSRFFAGISRYTPTLVSWNGSGFDLPVLHYRALLHGISAPRYWDTGDDDREFKFNNYLSRFHWRHIDLMDVLSGFQARANAPLDQLAQLVGAPGKLGMDGSKVWDAFQAGEIAAIRDYCETDALNTWLLYLRFELLRGRFDRTRFQAECDLVARTLEEAGRPHLDEFLAAWDRDRFSAVAYGA